MAVHAVVVDAAAVVGCDVAAEVALVLDVSLLVGLAVADPVLVVLVLVEEPALRALQVIGIRIHIKTPSCTNPPSENTTNGCTTRRSSCLLLLLECLYILVSSAGSQASKVGVFASIALVVIQVIQGELFKIVEVFALRVCQALI